MSTTARTCRCDRPIAAGEDCQKCGKPINAPTLYRPRGSNPYEVERRAKMSDRKAAQRERERRERRRSE